ncbi:hypothetical protein SLEP1_g49018 [Rubroshorea leprosula]|uniref:C3H1-type domain-containing protein n=2 Tax=Rubroshorea leprosula TaxID=152421 RepID=A0AAV5LXM7_9ROSI|nr:hypothetical protein SLEP1_g49018 [Rubroshorea leprosula]
MKRSRRSNRVSWAPGVNLCQVKLFLMGDCPSKVAIEPEVSLNAKSLWTLHLSGVDTDGLPPGFNGGNSLTNMKNEISHIPRIQWKCPPKFAVNANWQVVAGEESEEVEAQKFREIKVLEAVYPRPSAIPPSPSVSLDIKAENYDDSQTTVIPITPIEDEEDTDVPSDFPAQANISHGLFVSSTPNTTLHLNGPVLELPANERPPTVASTGLSPDIMLAASAVFTTIMKSKELGGMIDPDLLVKILSDPKTVETLVKDHGAPSANTSAPATAAKAPTSCGLSAPLFVSKSVTAPVPRNCRKPALDLPPIPANRNPSHSPSGDRVLPTSSMTTMPAVPTSSLGMNAVSASRTANDNVYSTSNRMQPAQPNSVPKVQPTISTTLVQPKSATVPPFAAPARPNSVSKFESTIRRTPAQSNSVTVPTFAAPAKVNPVKDINYIKNLIKEHGREKQEKQDFNMLQSSSHHHKNMQVPVQNLKSGQSGQLKLKKQKPCMYFGTPRGCRNGTNCPYLHDLSGGEVMEVPNAKRMKLSSEIRGR